MTSPGTSHTYTRRGGLHAVPMDGELVMMGLEQGEYYGLRDVAASIWTHLAEPRSLDELCTLVAEEYATSPTECRADIEAFLTELVSKRLVDET